MACLEFRVPPRLLLLLLPGIGPTVACAWRMHPTWASQLTTLESPRRPTANPDQHSLANNTYT